MDHRQASQSAAAGSLQDLVQRYHHAEMQRLAAENELRGIKEGMSSFLGSANLDRCSALIPVPRVEYRPNCFEIAPCHNYVYTIEYSHESGVRVTSSWLLEPGE